MKRTGRMAVVVVAQSKEDLVKQYNELTNEIKQLSEAIQTRQRSLIEIEGIFKYLNSQEKLKVEKEEPELVVTPNAQETKE